MIAAPNFADLEAMGLIHGFGERFSTYPQGVRTAKQIHSATVQDAAVQDTGAPLGEGDALISHQPGVLVGVRTADCVPILLVDPLTRVVAAIHAGWRGTAQGIASAAVRDISTRWQVDPANLRAAIGPSIGVCCYEIGPEVARQFGVEARHAVHPNGVHLNLPALNEMQLRNAGVSDIWKSAECTFCASSRFYSFRREREEAGRMLSFIGWRGPG